MRYCTFYLKSEAPEAQRVGVLEGSEVFELSPRATMMDLLRGDRGSRGAGRTGSGLGLELVRICAPVRRPGKILATIVNTQGMLGGSDVRLDRPRVDMKAPSTVIGPGDSILAPESGIRPEVELAVVVGRRLSSAGPREAREGIFGYTILNDVTAPTDSREDSYEAYRRDRGTGALRRSTLRGPLFRSKNHDTFCPMGPALATPDEVDDWAEVRMSTRFDGELVQEGSSSEYLFSPVAIVSYISGFLSLEPGDIVSCGSIGWTPAALGDLDPTEFLLPKKDGELDLEIEGIGSLLNPVSYG